MEYETRQGRKSTTFYRDGYKRKEVATKFDNVSELPKFSKYAKKNTLKQRVEKGLIGQFKRGKKRFLEYGDLLHGYTIPFDQISFIVATEVIKDM